MTRKVSRKNRFCYVYAGASVSPLASCVFFRQLTRAKVAFAAFILIFVFDLNILKFCLRKERIVKVVRRSLFNGSCFIDRYVRHKITSLPLYYHQYDVYLGWKPHFHSIVFYFLYTSIFAPWTYTSIPKRKLLEATSSFLFIHNQIITVINHT